MLLEGYPKPPPSYIVHCFPLDFQVAQMGYLSNSGRACSWWSSLMRATLLLLCSFVLSSPHSPAITTSPAASLVGNNSKSVSDHSALISFKTNIYDDPYGALTSWDNKSLHFCQWEGVTCGSRHPERVIALDLPSLGLAGTISPSVANLTFLRRLSLQENKLDGSIPQELGHLHRLRLLNLSMNSLEGQVPSSLGNCRHLILLNLGRNLLNGQVPHELGSLPQLIRLILGSNNLTGGIPTSLANLSSLDELDLSHNSITVAKEADDWSFLTALTNCGKLRELHIGNNSLSGVLPNSISNLSTDIQSLVFWQNQISGSLPSDIGNLKNLIVLAFGSNLLTGNIPASLGNLNALLGLDMSDNNFSGQIPPSLGNISQLNELYLEENILNGTIPTHLGNCKNLQSLDLSNNQLTGPIPIEILSLSSLSEFLHLSHNELHGFLPSEIGSLINVNDLDVSENRLYGKIPDSIGKCVVLVNLNMSGNFFEGIIPTSLGNLKGLQFLDLSSNNLSGHIPEYFQKFHSLQFLNLSFNNLESEVPLGGVFANMSAFSLIGNRKICGGINELHLPPCPSTQPHGKKHKAAIIVVIIAVASGVLGVTLILFFVLLYRTRKTRMRRSSMAAMRIEHVRVSYAELVRATDRFSSANLIGVGSFGSVYKGVMDWDDIKMVAVKILNLQLQGASRSFIAECEALRSIRHRNLVKIITACSSVDFRGNDFKALVLEFMENGSLERWLHPEANEQCPTRNLNLEQRVSIAIDVASAVDYLHHHSPVPIVHCDLKPSNILLDGDMTARVSDFGLAKFLSESTNSFSISASLAAIKGSVGYIAPEYGLGSQVSTHGDAYSYGILLLEMFTGRRPTDETFTESQDLHQFVEMAFPTQIMNIVDPQLIREEEFESIDDIQQRCAKQDGIQECLISVINIGLQCSSKLPKERLHTGDIVKKMTAARQILGRV